MSSSDWCLTSRLGKSRALNYLKPAGVLTERLRPIRAQFFSTVTQRRHDSRCSEFSVAPQQIRGAATVDCTEWNLNWIQVSERHSRRTIGIFQFSFIVSEHQKADVSQTRQSAPVFHKSPKWTCWLDNDQTLSSWFTRNWFLVWQLSRSETLMMKAAKTLNVHKDEVLHIPFCTKEMTVKLQSVACVCEDWRCQ